MLTDQMKINAASASKQHVHFYGPPLISAGADAQDKWKVTPKSAPSKQVCACVSSVKSGDGMEEPAR